MDIVFAVMPFADLGRPAIGVSLLAAATRRIGYTAAIEYFNLKLAELIGAELFQKISGSYAPDLLIGEWFFADDLFKDEIPHWSDYLERILSPTVSPEVLTELQQARAVRTRYLDECAQQIALMKPRLVGFTSTFHQTCASLAVAKRLKAMEPAPKIIFGGANCEGEMGSQLLDSFPWIDIVCGGESDETFPRLLEKLLGGRQENAVLPGILERGAREAMGRSQPVREMDVLPVPEYDDYFEQLESSTLGRSTAMHVVVETSRGCWWGAKSHCTFCGLNGETMAFRSKSADRAFEEIKYLSQRHGLKKVGCVDNILDLRYIDTLFPRLAESGLSLELFYEVKANLRFDQLWKLYRGGMRQIQPGIESLSDSVLRLMHKGVSAAQNIQLLRWCRELGIDCAWNLLAGFPGEPPTEYARMAELVPLLTHLEPPCSCGEIRLDRFSPFHLRPADFGFQKVRPARAYFYVFPLEWQEMNRLAYFFDFDYQDGRDPVEYLGPLRSAVGQWWDLRLAGNDRPRLEASFAGVWHVTDTRPVARKKEQELDEVAGRILRRCDVATCRSGLLRELGQFADESAVISAVEELLDQRLLIQLGEQYLSLAVFPERVPKGTLKTDT
jgi:ribosomal peptide maturation radical SAM protein 1